MNIADKMKKWKDSDESKEYYKLFKQRDKLIIQMQTSTWNQYKRLSKQIGDLCDKMAELMNKI